MTANDWFTNQYIIHDTLSYRILTLRCMTFTWPYFSIMLLINNIIWPKLEETFIETSGKPVVKQLVSLTYHIIPLFLGLVEFRMNSSNNLLGTFAWISFGSHIKARRIASISKYKCKLEELLVARRLNKRNPKCTVDKVYTSRICWLAIMSLQKMVIHANCDLNLKA